MKLDKKENESVKKLLQNEDFKVLLNAMGNYTEALNKKLVMSKLDTGDLHNVQGQTKVMVLIMEAITEAPSNLDKLSQPKT